MRQKSFAYDLGYIQAALEVMESYLLSEEVFWPLSGRPPGGSPQYPRLTLGNLLLAETRLNGYLLDPAQEASRQRVMAEIDQLRSKWMVSWENKASRSFTVRLRMWAEFLEEYNTSPQENSDRYTYEVRLRVILRLLLTECTVQPTEIEILSGLDASLKSVLKMNGFIWEPEVEKAFSLEDYWYLYGILPGREKKT